MFFYLFFLFITVPIVEIWLLIRIGQAIDAGPTITLVVLTGLVGAALARREGMRTMSKINQSLARGEMPAKELVEGLMIFIAGVLLVTPGVLTDGVGLLVLIPPIRAWLRRRLTAYFKDRVHVVTEQNEHGAHVHFSGGFQFGQRPADDVDDIIDVEHRDVTDEHFGELDQDRRN